MTENSIEIEKRIFVNIRTSPVSNRVIDLSKCNTLKYWRHIYLGRKLIVSLHKFGSENGFQ